MDHVPEDVSGDLRRRRREASQGGLELGLLSEVEPDGTVLAAALATADEALATGAARSVRRALAVAERLVASGVGEKAEPDRIVALRRRLDEVR